MRQATSGIILAAIFSACALHTPAQAQSRLAEMAPEEAYLQCMALVRSDADAAFEAAIAWRDEGGGAAARHCTAMALAHRGQFAEAAARLEDLAQTMNGFGARERADVLGQAGRIWLRAGEGGRAYGALTAALQLDPDNPEIWIDRGEALARGGKYWEAIDDFNEALQLSPDHIDGLIFRGAAYRLLGVHDLAREDLVHALAADPGHPDALMELGLVHMATGAREAARESWVKAISVAPGSPAADAARAALERIDVKTR